MQANMFPSSEKHAISYNDESVFELDKSNDISSSLGSGWQWSLYCDELT